jgi:hypothetical protein
MKTASLAIATLAKMSVSCLQQSCADLELVRALELTRRQRHLNKELKYLWRVTYGNEAVSVKDDISCTCVVIALRRISYSDIFLCKH